MWTGMAGSTSEADLGLPWVLKYVPAPEKGCMLIVMGGNDQGRKNQMLVVSGEDAVERRGK